MSVTVLTASIAERAGFRVEAEASVAAQTYAPIAHLVGVDYERRGAAVTYNSLARAVDSEWMTFLDDDDLLDKNHLELLMNASHGFDLVYSGCRCEGNFHYSEYNAPFDRDELKKHSLIPITAMVKTDLFHKVEGMRSEWGYDWDFWKRVVETGAKVNKIDDVTWTYRFHVSPDHKQQSFGEI